MSSSRKIFLVTCVNAETPDLIPHFFSYYRTLGVDDFLVILHTKSPSDPKRAESLTALAACGIKPTHFWEGKFLGPEKQARLNGLLDSHVRTDDWFLNADLDEFVECDQFSRHPQAFGQLLSLCDVFGYNFIEGRLVDMIAPNGLLPQVRKDVLLWEQFPIACNATRRILRGNCRKIVACKGHLRCTYGAHGVLGEPKRGHPTMLRVNHFKWDQGVIERLGERYTNYVHAGYRHAVQSLRFLKHLRSHGTINLRHLDYVGRTNALGHWAISPRLLKFMLLHLPIGSPIFQLGISELTQELSKLYKLCLIEDGLYDPTGCVFKNGWYDVTSIKDGLRVLEPAAILIDAQTCGAFAQSIHLIQPSSLLIVTNMVTGGHEREFHMLAQYFPNRRSGLIDGGRTKFGIIDASV